jgi:hypothetical protein
MSLVAAVVVALVTLAGPYVDAATSSLRTDPVFVDPSAERAITEAEAAQLRARIKESGAPVFVAVLPAAAIDEVGDVNALPRSLAEGTGLAGTYAVVAGNSFRAAGPNGAAALATAAFQARRDDGTAAVLSEFVDQVVAARPTVGDGAGEPAPAPVAPSAEDKGGSNLLLIAALAVGGAGLFTWSRRRTRARQAEAARAEAADRQLLQAELSVLADDVMRLEPQVTLHPEARQDYDAAVTRYRAAEAALEYADEPVDLQRVARVVAEAHYAMDRARARLEGREPPPPPDVLREQGARDEPGIDLDERGEPVYGGGWGGGGFYGPGWFGGGGGGLLTGLLLGRVLGGWGGGYQHDDVDDHDDDDDRGGG